MALRLVTAVHPNGPGSSPLTRANGRRRQADPLHGVPSPSAVVSRAPQGGRDLVDATTDWRQAAACRGHDPELWFSALPADRDRAATLCATCPVRSRCLSAALGFEATGGGNYGLWGGYSERDRRQALTPTRATTRRGPSRWGHAR